MKLDPAKFSQPERYSQPHPYLNIRVGRKGEIFTKPSEGNHWQSRVLKPKITNKGYEQVGIYVDGKKKWFLVHRLCWETYNQQAVPDGLVVNHINENKRDNRAENLNLMTFKENLNHGTRNTRIAKTQSKPVLQLTIDGNVVKEWSSTKEVQRQTGWSQGNISQTCCGKHNTAYGFKWKYKN